MFELKDKVAIVTGATSGIGKAAAIAYAKQGAKVVVSGRRETEGGRVVSEIKASGGDALFVKADVSIESDVEELFLKTIAHYGKVDSVFLNSGVFKFGSLAEQTGENLQDQLNVNVLGAYYGVKSGAQHLSRGGTIILNSSVVGSIGMPNASAYSLTKGAVNILVKSAAIELASRGIRVNAVAPGPVWTEGAEAMTGSREGFEAAMLPMVPLGRIGDVNEVAAAVVFLASDEAGFVTGQILGVDGGINAK